MYGFYIPFQSRCIRKLAGSPNHLIGLEEECWGNRQPKSLSGLQVDDELELHMGVPIGRPGIEEEGHSVECAAVNPTLYTREEFGTKLHARDYFLASGLDGATRCMRGESPALAAAPAQSPGPGRRRKPQST